MELISVSEKQTTSPPGEMENTGELPVKMINWYDDMLGDQVWHRGDVALLGDVPHVNYSR